MATSTASRLPGRRRLSRGLFGVWLRGLGGRAVEAGARVMVRVRVVRRLRAGCGGAAGPGAVRGSRRFCDADGEPVRGLTQAG
jgi:hypothetical protein